MRKTKILATIGPATCEPDSLKKLFEAGCNVVRINMSHSTQEEATAIIANVRAISDHVIRLRMLALRQVGPCQKLGCGNSLLRRNGTWHGEAQCSGSEKREDAHACRF